MQIMQLVLAGKLAQLPIMLIIQQAFASIFAHLLQITMDII